MAIPAFWEGLSLQPQSKSAQATSLQGPSPSLIATRSKAVSNSGQSRIVSEELNRNREWPWHRNGQILPKHTLTHCHCHCHCHCRGMLAINYHHHHPAPLQCWKCLVQSQEPEPLLALEREVSAFPELIFVEPAFYVILYIYMMWTWCEHYKVLWQVRIWSPSLGKIGGLDDFKSEKKADK